MATYEAFETDPRLAALNKWVEKDNEERTKQEMIKAISERLLSHIR